MTTETTARPRQAPPGTPSPKATPEREVPFSLGAETALVGSLVIGPGEWDEVLELVPSPDFFFGEHNQIIFRVLLELREKKTPCDGVILSNALRSQKLLDAAGGVEYLNEIFNSVPSSAHAVYYAGIVRQKHLCRQMILAGERITRSGYNGDADVTALLDSAEQEIYRITSTTNTVNVVAPLVDVLHEAFAALDKQNGEALSGLATGFRELDQLTCGLQRGELILIGARPSVGKTSLAMGMAEMLSVDLKIPGLVFTMEMSKLQLSQRMMASRSGVDMQKIRRNYLTAQDRDDLSRAVGEMSSAPLYLEDKAAISIGEIRSTARKAKLKHGIEFIVVDYVQLCEGRGDIREQQISSVSRGLKALARDLNIPVIALSQLNRQGESAERRPRPSDLRESGSLEQDADVVMLLHREAVMHRGDQAWLDQNPELVNLAELCVAKQRQGPCDTIKLTFMDRQVRFVDYAPAGV